MRIKTLLAIAAVAAAAGACAPQKTGGGGSASSGPVELTTEDQKALYALGFIEGERVGVFNMTPAEQALFLRGLSDQFAGQKPALENPMSMGPKISEMARTRGKARAEAKAAAEVAKGKEYADKAAQEPGVEKTASGMLYKEITAGTGASPTTADRVKVQYKGTLTDGTEFDSSYSRKEPATFPVTGVIPCWTEGVQKMKVGGKARLVCPSSIAYGDQGRPPKIPGGATLVFEVELVEVVPAAEPAVSPKLEPAPAKADVAVKKVEPAAAKKVEPAAGQKAKHPGQK